MNDDTPTGVSPIAIPLPRSVKDIRGQRFGRWTVESYAGSNDYRQSTWRCVCSCPEANRKVVSINQLQVGKSKSCGCLYRETRRSSAMTHGGCYDPEYGCFMAMMKRCYDPNHESYPEYGAKGVIVQPSWFNNYPQFKKDMPPRPSDIHTVDRIDGAGNYTSDNTKWSTPTEQARNRRTNIYFTHNGETLCQAAWSEKLGWHPSKIKNRRRAGWSIERTLSTP